MSEKILSYLVEAEDRATPVLEASGAALREALVEGPRQAREALSGLDASLEVSTEKMLEHQAALSEMGQGLVEGLESVSGAMLENVLGGAQSAGEALEGFLRQSLDLLAGMFSRQAAQFLASTLLKGRAKQKEAASTSAANIGQVFTGQFAAMSQAPFPLNLTAPAVAAAMLAAAQAGLAAASAAGAAAGAAGVPLAEGGFVPALPGADPNRDSVAALLQPGELVVPKPFAEEFPGGLGGGGAVNAFVFPAEPSVMGEMMEAMSQAVERFGYRLKASEVAA